jgi:hypothetical protein
LLAQQGPTRPTAFCSNTSKSTPQTTRKMMLLCERVTPIWLSAFSSCCICAALALPDAEGVTGISPAISTSCVLMTAQSLGRQNEFEIHFSYLKL